MTQTSTRRVLLCFCSLTALLSCAVAQEEDVGNNSCSSTTMLFKQLSTQLAEATRCAENITSQWSDNQTAVVINSLQTLTVILQKHQKKTVCQKFEPKECPAAAAQSNGGLVCVTIKKRRYCKPMCNEGFDFAFLRNSRLYEECSADTRFKWTTHYIGGNKLAVCNKSSRSIAGAKTAYFPKNQNCLTTKSNSDLEAQLIQQFKSELMDIEGEPEYDCLLCG